jgi:hypothetical protein
MPHSTSRPAELASATFGRRLLPVVLDQLAESDPSRVYAAIPLSGELSHGFRDITVVEVARCVNYMSAWLEEQFGCSSNFETVSYLGIPDIRGAILFLAAVKCGYKVCRVSWSFWICPTNTSLPSFSSHHLEIHLPPMQL